MRLLLASLLLAACTGGPDDTGVGPPDADGDGHAGEADCDDADPDVFVGAVEACNGIDDDCDGVVDPSWSADATLWYRDADADGFGDLLDQAPACAAADGWVDNPEDCDDTTAALAPDAPEVCNGIDDNCDGVVDPANAQGAAAWHPDGDGDGFGAAATTATACTAPAGFIADGTDCDDGDPAVSPGASEVCNGVDDDCDGVTDPEGAPGGDTWHLDGDDDGYGDPEVSVVQCSAPAGYVADGTDCDDGDDGANPAAVEVVGDGLDQDCFDGDLACADVELRGALGAGVLVVETAGAGDDTLPSCSTDGPDGGEEVTAHWVAPFSGAFTFAADGGTLVVLDDGGTCGGSELGCTEGTSGSGPSVALALRAGEEVVVALDAGGATSLTLALATAAADDARCGDGADDGDGLTDCLDPECASDRACDVRLADASVGSALGVGIAVGTTVGAGDDWPGSCGGEYGEDVGLAWIAPADGTYTASLSGSAYDTVLTAWTPDGGTELACNEDATDGDVTSAVTLTVHAGQLVILVVDGHNRDAGDYVLSVE